MGLFTQILFKKDGGIDKSTTDYASIDLAEQAFHVAMASAIGKAEYNKAIMFVFDGEGTIKFKRVWVRN